MFICVFKTCFFFSDKVEMEIFLNGELMAHKSEETHKILNKWPSNGVLIMGQDGEV